MDEEILEMNNKWIVLVGDPDTDTWAVAVNTPNKTIAQEFYDHMRNTGDKTPAIIIYTGDFVTV